VACSARGSGVPPADAPSATALAAGVVAGQCPPSSPEHVPNPGPGLNDSLVPVTAHKLVLCLCSGMNATALPGRSKTKVISDTQAVDTWRQRFNSLPAVLPGTYHCPMDDGTSVLARFVASATSHTVVKVGLRGCEWTTNGSINCRTAQVIDTTFLARLQGLISG
jgi:hypothetical protein